MWPRPRATIAGASAARERDRRPQVDLEHPVDLSSVSSSQQPAGRQRRVGDQHVDLAPASLDQAIDLRAIGQVARRSPARELAGERLERVGSAAGHQSSRPAGGERAGDRAADPARGAGDQHAAADDAHGGAV